jgi:hypothetical protein
MRLFDIADQYNGLFEMLEQDASNEELQQMLAGMQGKLEDKIDAVLSIRAGKVAEAKALVEESKRLSARAAQYTNEAERLDQLVEHALSVTGLEKVKTLKFTAWMQMSNPSVIVLDESAIPKEFYVSKEPEIRKSMILESWKNGQVVPGVEIRQSKSLRVR